MNLFYSFSSFSTTQCSVCSNITPHPPKVATCHEFINVCVLTLANHCDQGRVRSRYTPDLRDVREAPKNIRWREALVSVFIPEGPGRWSGLCCPPDRQPGSESAARQVGRWPDSYRPRLQTSPFSPCTRSAVPTGDGANRRVSTSSFARFTFTTLSVTGFDLNYRTCQQLSIDLSN